MLHLAFVILLDLVPKQLQETSKIFQKLRNINSFCFVSIVLPSGLLVSFLFWFIFLYDPLLLAPQEIFIIFPLSSQINCHLIPLIPLFFEILDGNHYLPNYTNGLITIIATVLLGIARCVLFFR